MTRQRKLQLIGAALVLGSPDAACATGLACPESGTNAVTLSPSEERVFVSGDNTEVADTMDQLIADLRTNNSSISYDDLTNAAISTYCPLIVNSPSLGSEQKVSRIWALDTLLRARLAPLFGRR